MTSAVTTDVWSNDDFAAVREIDKWQEFQFETSALVAATEDLRIMKWYIDPLFVGLREKADDQERSPFDAGAPLPTWQYKPSMLIRSRLKSGGKPQSRPRPPQSSGA
jgi:hypothetical protein